MSEIGIVTSFIKGQYNIISNNSLFICSIRGKIRFNNKEIKVGDRVLFSKEKLIIEDILERKNELIRPSIANIDLLFIVLSLTKPEFSLDLAFEFLTYSNINNIPSILIVSKIDNEDDYNKFLNIKNIMDKCHVTCMPFSKYNEDYISKIKQLVTGKSVCFMGQTGVGKSSLINCLDSSFNREIGEYSNALGRGKHQTKEVILLPFSGGYLADSPGFSSLRLEITPLDLSHFFPGFDLLYPKCNYSNCLHEIPCGCKVIDEVNNSIYPKEAYETYLTLLKRIIEENKRRKK
ncbi:MAG: ribosome small subunit-dependent GTPase A [Bacilli bacterium]